jgi:hypothetical protein
VGVRTCLMSAEQDVLGPQSLLAGVWNRAPGLISTDGDRPDNSDAARR